MNTQHHFKLNLAAVLVFVGVVAVILSAALPFFAGPKTQASLLLQQQQLRQLAFAVNAYITDIGEGKLPPRLDVLVRNGLIAPVETMIPDPSGKKRLPVLYFPEVVYALYGQEVLLAAPYPVIHEKKKVRVVVFPDMNVKTIPESQFQAFLKRYKHRFRRHR